MSSFALPVRTLIKEKVRYFYSKCATEVTRHWESHAVHLVKAASFALAGNVLILAKWPI